MLNRVILIGRLTRDPELKRTPTTGVALAKFTLAVDRYFQGKDKQKETDFINVVVWGKMAELCKEYLGKGRLAAVDGRLLVRSWETPQGERRTMTEVRADDVRFLDRGPQSQSRGEYSGRSASNPQPPARSGSDDEYDRAPASNAGTRSAPITEDKLVGDSGFPGAASDGFPGAADDDFPGLKADDGFPSGPGSDSAPLPESGSGKKDFGNVSDSRLDEEIDLDDDDPFKEDF